MRARILPLLAVAAAALAPATAGAEDLGCAGAPSEPLTYVCVSVYPENAVPSFGPPSERSVTVPSVCLFVAGCTAPQTVPVPVPGSVEPGSGDVVDVHYAGGEGLREDILYPVAEYVAERLQDEVPRPICVRDVCYGS